MWRKNWISNGSPRHVHVADIMRRTRAEYHYVIRCIKNDNQLLKNGAMARGIAQRKSRELWTEVNKIKSSKSHSTNINKMIRYPLTFNLIHPLILLTVWMM